MRVRGRRDRGNLAARLATDGNAVSVVVRGPHLDAIRTNGLALSFHE